MDIEKQNQCMKLEDIAAIRYGHSVRGAFINNEDSDIKILQTKNFSVDGIHWEDCLLTNFCGRAQPWFLKEGDIVFLVRNNNLGYNALLIDDSVNSVSEAVMTGPMMYVIKCDTRKVLPEYLTWWLNQGPAQDYFKSRDSGETRTSIKREVLVNTAVSIPTLERQKELLKLHKQAVLQVKKLQKHADNISYDIKEDSDSMSDYFRNRNI